MRLVGRRADVGRHVDGALLAEGLDSVYGVLATRGCGRGATKSSAFPLVVPRQRHNVSRWSGAGPVQDVPGRAGRVCCTIW